MALTTFYLIRHGERDTPHDFLPGQAAGIRLTELGRLQAERIAAHLKHESIHHIFSSPLERAVETAGPLAREFKVPVQLSAALTELDFGEWTAKTVAEVAAEPQWRNFNHFRSGTRMPGGESALEVQFRVTRELLRWRDSCPGQGIACVSHADTIRLALVYFLGMPLDLFDRIEIGVGSISVLTLADWGARVVRLNEIPRA